MTVGWTRVLTLLLCAVLLAARPAAADDAPGGPRGGLGGDPGGGQGGGLGAGRAGPNDLAGLTVWLGDSRGALATFELATGRVEVIGRMRVVMTDIAFAKDGRLFGVSFSALYEIDPQTADVRAIAPHGVPCGNALAIGPDDWAYVMGCSSGLLARIDPDSGVTEPVVRLPFNSSGDLAFADGALMLSAGGRTGDRLVEIDLATRRAREIGPFGVFGVYGLVADASGRLFAGAGQAAYRVDPATGRLTEVSRFGGGRGLSLAARSLGQTYGWALAASPDVSNRRGRRIRLAAAAPRENRRARNESRRARD